MFFSTVSPYYSFFTHTQLIKTKWFLLNPIKMFFREPTLFLLQRFIKVPFWQLQECSVVIEVAPSEYFSCQR